MLFCQTKPWRYSVSYDIKVRKAAKLHIRVIKKTAFSAFFAQITTWMLVSHCQLSCHLSDQSSITFLMSFRHPHGRKMATFSHHAIVTSAMEVMFATVGRSAGIHKNYWTHFSGRHQVDRGRNMLKFYVMTLLILL